MDVHRAPFSASMRALLFSLVLIACNGASTPPPPEASREAAASPPAMTLFDFDEASPSEWYIQNDGVMGGRSKGSYEITDGALRFEGTVVTQGGGFTSVLTNGTFDLSPYAAIEMRVRGGGRTFEFELDDGTRMRGRQVSRRGQFPTADNWQVVRVDFDDLDTSVFGRQVNAKPLAPEAIQSVGIYIIDGIDGPFEVEVDWIRAVE